jgi:adenosylcobinamide-GDP ribazoletransferase
MLLLEGAGGTAEQQGQLPVWYDAASKEVGMRSEDRFASLALRWLWQPCAWLIGRVRDQYAEFVAAVHFLTLLPLPGEGTLFERQKEGQPRLVMGSLYYPLVGLLVGFLLFLLAEFSASHLPPLVMAALLVVGGVILTGGLHLDGVMDSCDGLFGGVSRERRLAIMHDSRVGSFGVLGAVSLLLLRFCVIVSLPLSGLLAALLVAPALARWTMVLCASLFPPARPSGLGAAFHQTITLRRLLLAGLFSVLIALLFAHLAGLITWMVSSLLGLVICVAIARMLGGLTGDVCGAIGEVTEVSALLALLLLHASL